MVGEPTQEEAVEILRGLRDRYEAHHKLHITDDALEAAVHLSERYISDRCLPDKAIDLMDEACSSVRIQSYTAPPDVKEQEQALSALIIEKKDAIAHQDFEKAASLRDEERQLRAEIERSARCGIRSRPRPRMWSRRKTLRRSWPAGPESRLSA